MQNAVTRLVESDAFSATWTASLAASHRALVATAAGGTADGAIAIGANGEAGIQLAPTIERVAQSLTDQGFGFAASIPVIDRTIVVAQSDALVTVAVVYAIAVAVGWWLPLTALALFALGVLLARRRTSGLVGSGVGLAIGGATAAIGLAIGGAVVGLSAPQLGVPAAALGAVYAQVVDGMHRTAVIVALVGVILAVLAPPRWGPTSRAPTPARRRRRAPRKRREPRAAARREIRRWRGIRTIARISS